MERDEAAAESRWRIIAKWPWLIPAVSAVKSGFTAYQAGCAGDLKDGSGIMAEAIRLEDIAMVWGLGAISMVVVAVATGARPRLELRLALALAAAIPAALGLWLLDFWIEGLGVVARSP